MSYLRDEKNKVRTEYLAKRDMLEKEYLDAASERICMRIAALASYRFSDTLLLYYPIKGEFNVLPLAFRALKDGKKVAFPRCDAQNRKMDFHFIDDISDLSPHSYGIPEPPEDGDIYDKSDRSTALCVIPAVVYDKHGFRLGYGGGYYDRYLSDFGGTKIGAVLSGFVVDSVPKSRYDAHVDVLVTEKGVISFYGG